MSAEIDDWTTCTGCGVVIHCGGTSGHHGDLPTAIRELADEYERGAMLRTGAGVAKRLRSLLDGFRPTPDHEGK